MANLKDKIEVELENIDRILNEFPKDVPLHQLSTLELAGVATLLHNFYNGIENILKQILKEKEISIPESASWHRNLINTSEEQNIISSNTKTSIGEYLAFRHFFSHAYALDLYPQKLDPLVENINNVFDMLKTDIQKFLKKRK